MASIFQERKNGDIGETMAYSHALTVAELTFERIHSSDMHSGNVEKIHNSSAHFVLKNVRESRTT